MATPDFTTATPGAGAGAAMALMGAQQLVDTQRANTDSAVNQGYLTSTYTKRTLPGIQGAAASAGQHYGTARQKVEANSYEDFLKGSHDIQSGLQRTLDDLTRQRMYASIGLII
jgi:hypothetical protein